MHRRAFASFALLVLVLANAATRAAAATESERDTPGNLVVTLEPGTSIDDINRRYGTHVVEAIPESHRERLPDALAAAVASRGPACPR